VAQKRTAKAKATSKRVATGSAKKKATVKPTPSSQVIENVVAAMEQVKATVPGTTVIQKAQIPVYGKPARKPRDVDVLVRTPAGGQVYSLGIEVKDHGRPLDVGHIGKLVDHWHDVRTDRFAIVSTSGFTKDADEKSQRGKDQACDT
jgi:hypothetical protein